MRLFLKATLERLLDCEFSLCCRVGGVTHDLNRATDQGGELGKFLRRGIF